MTAKALAAPLLLALALWFPLTVLVPWGLESVAWLTALALMLGVGTVLLLRRRKKLVAHFPNLALVRGAIGPGASLRRHLPPLLFFIGLAAALLAAARPAAANWTTLPVRRSMPAPCRFW